jgi:hypothetical protein
VEPLVLVERGLAPEWALRRSGLNDGVEHA